MSDKLTTREIEIACMVHAGVKPVTVCRRCNCAATEPICIYPPLSCEKCGYVGTRYPTGAEGIPLLKAWIENGGISRIKVFADAMLPQEDQYLLVAYLLLMPPSKFYEIFHSAFCKEVE